ncbi:hypothetical protein LSAT2_017897, partial [Lamellibrachia satsuma]
PLINYNRTSVSRHVKGCSCFQRLHNNIACLISINNETGSPYTPRCARLFERPWRRPWALPKSRLLCPGQSFSLRFQCPGLRRSEVVRIPYRRRRIPSGPVRASQSACSRLIHHK